ncbi:hypothetical protein Syun_023811 [Stephania yunnanensis]|uniref:Uncharacterized protein n=1 Tax=Stephania yunnanensis TaxID=152371 RepID=A0AAP0F9L4_9MAGN
MRGRRRGNNGRRERTARAVAVRRWEMVAAAAPARPRMRNRRGARRCSGAGLTDGNTFDRLFTTNQWSSIRSLVTDPTVLKCMARTKNTISREETDTQELKGARGRNTQQEDTEEKNEEQSNEGSEESRGDSDSEKNETEDDEGKSGEKEGDEGDSGEEKWRKNGDEGDSGDDEESGDEGEEDDDDDGEEVESSGEKARREGSQQGQAAQRQ